MEFHAVRCPNCESRGVSPAPVVMEIATGLSRGKCPVCRKRVWASADGREMRVAMVDAPRREFETATVAKSRILVRSSPLSREP
ncbi:MAG: hypothetical protein IT301_05230 [Dehalococcoidia bacterium]|nr:hypothetical protein [Dehalococcoidia bacterium]